MKDVKVAVLGPIPKDNINTHRRQTFEKYGCAVYTIATLASIAGSGFMIHTVRNVRHILGQVGILDLFTVVIGGKDVILGKADQIIRSLDEIDLDHVSTMAG